ncbi:MAG: hypothetical protein JSS11_04725 [Verrucomicrobia bacterium]|nr:hypothetical protein [Verrucomicrobiota bacterium]
MPTDTTITGGFEPWKRRPLARIRHWSGRAACTPSAAAHWLVAVLSANPVGTQSEHQKAALQFQIELVLEEIEHMKYGDDYLTRSPEMREKYTDKNIPPPSVRLGPDYGISDAELDA